MEAQALFWLALKGGAVAAVPLAYVALSRDPAKYRKLAWVTAFLTLDLIMFGAFTRLTDSGLGCPDWPGCYGHSNPLSAGESIRAAESAQPTGPVTMTKAWIEMLHRYFAMGVGLLIIVLTVQAWRRVGSSGAAPSPWLATAALAWVCVQGAFGALTVTQKLQPLIVTVHLLGGIGLLALLVWLALRESPSVPVGPSAQRLRPLAVAALCVTLLQVALGGWVSTNYAVLACSDFPLCQGAWVPPLDFEHAFTLWRDLGRTGEGAIIPFQALVTIHWVHRAFALVAAATVGTLVWSAWRVAGLERTARWLLAVLVLQLATGLSNVILNWPLVAAVLHSGGAALLVALLVAVIVRAAGAQSR
ncbi:MAG TPA: COX15/CtaA family protein [Burkholderiaceae bacterium]|nr:COX15/CtaA family protein [Burkholderiaceae bacterium]HQR76846.1 COX15/CtaA family protein [Burkholderiaceae bacterium]